MVEDIVIKRKRGRPPKIKPQSKTEAIVQNIETLVTSKPTVDSDARYLSGYGHGQKAPKPSESKK